MVAKAQSPAPRPWKRRTKVGGNVAVQVFLVFLLLAGVNTWAFWNSWRFDLTSDQRFAIPPATRQLLRGLDQRIDVVVPFSFAPNKIGNLQRNVFDRALGVCKEFELLNPAFRVEAVIDVGRDIDGWAKIRSDERRPIEDYNQFFLFCGDRREVLSIEDLADIQIPSALDPRAEPTLRSQRVVEALSTAVQRVMTLQRPRILFTQGSGEVQRDSKNAQWSLAAFSRSLRDRGYQLASVDLRRAAAIPEDVELLIMVAGGPDPFDPLLGERRDVVLRYLDGGGRLLLFHPILGISGLEARLRDLGISPDPSGIIVDRPTSRLDPRRPELLQVTTFDEVHPVTKGFRAGEFLVQMAACGAIAVKEPALAILHSGKECWLERGRNVRQDADDPSGPFGLVAVYDPPVDAPATRKGRVAVFGCWTVALDPGFRGPARRLVLNTVYWLTDRTDLAAEPGRPAQIQRVVLDDTSRAAFFWTCLVLLPFCSLASGLVVYWIRRR